MRSGGEKNIWGGIVKVPGTPAAGDKVSRVQAGTSELAKLLEHWGALPSGERPALHGLSTAGAGTNLSIELLLTCGNEPIFFILEVAPSSAFPRPSALWPFSLWWEEELRTFNGVEFAGMIPERDATWRPL
ncbi:MAG: hypothetical protein AB7K68_05990 [Bacteriovoracia bacterium]